MLKFCALIILVLLFVILAVYNGRVSDDAGEENENIKLSQFGTKLDNENEVQMINYEAEDEVVNKSTQKISNYSKSANKAEEKTKYNDAFKSHEDNQEQKVKIDIKNLNVDNVIVILGDKNKDQKTKEITKHEEKSTGNGDIHKIKEETSVKCNKGDAKETSENYTETKKKESVNNANNQNNGNEKKKTEEITNFNKYHQDNDYYLSYFDNDLINKQDNDMMKSKEKSEDLVKQIKFKEKSEGAVTEMKYLSMSKEYDEDYGHKHADTKKPEDSFFYRLKDVPDTYDALFVENLE